MESTARKPRSSQWWPQVSLQRPKRSIWRRSPRRKEAAVHSCESSQARLKKAGLAYKNLGRWWEEKNEKFWKSEKKNSSMKKIRKFILILYYNNRAEKICQNSFSRAKFYGHAIFEKKNIHSRIIICNFRDFRRPKSFFLFTETLSMSNNNFSQLLHFWAFLGPFLGM